MTRPGSNMNDFKNRTKLQPGRVQKVKLAARCRPQLSLHFLRLLETLLLNRLKRSLWFVCLTLTCLYQNAKCLNIRPAY